MHRAVELCVPSAVVHCACCGIAFPYGISRCSSLIYVCPTKKQCLLFKVEKFKAIGQSL